MPAVSTAALATLLVCAPPLSRRSDDPDGWHRSTVFYEVFVRSFVDSDGDGHGDLRGLISKLDVLRDLGVTGLWLMPIYDGPTDHGYAVKSYGAIEPRYGTMADAQALLTTAHERQLAVLLDYVPNHVSTEHPWFAAARGGDRNAQDHFVIAREEPKGWTTPWDTKRAGDVWTYDEKLGGWYYHAFTPDMPDLDLSNRATRTSMLRAARDWMDRGADGFRVDAVRYLFEGGPKRQADQSGNFRFLGELRALTRPTGGLLVNEAWTKTQAALRYAASGQLVFDFDRAYAIRAALDDSDVRGLEAAVRFAEREAPSGVDMAAFATNHDAPVPRAGGRGVDGAMVSAAMVLLGGGVPFLWQGDELAMNAIDENQIRRPMRWTAEPGAGFTSGKPWREIGGRKPNDNFSDQKDAPTSMWRRLQSLLQARSKSAALTRGVRYPVAVKGAKSVWAFVRHDGSDRVLVLINASPRAARLQLDLRKLPFEANGSLEGFIGTQDELRLRRGRVNVLLAGHQIRAWRARPDPNRLTVRIGRPGIVGAAAGGLERGLRYSDDRAMGFRRDVADEVSCARLRSGDHDACSIRFARESRYELDAIEWRARLPPGPYRIDVDLAAVGAGGGPSLSVEGEPMPGRARRLSHDVMVHDGVLNLRGVAGRKGGVPVQVSAIHIRPAKQRRADAKVAAYADRIEIISGQAGVVRWRMNDGAVEPCERTPLVRRGRRFVATLGPWPPGTVTRVGWVLQTQTGFHTGAGGTEVTTTVPPS